MAELRQAERTIINTLIDRGIFTSSVVPSTRRQMVTAVQALQRPATQQRVNSYLREMFGEVPQNFQENLLFLSGVQQLTPSQTHVLLATCKAVINAPELQGVTEDRVIACDKLITTVNSEVTELTDKQIRHSITDLFVDRFHLFTVDRPLDDAADEASEIEDYWDVALDFTNIVQCLVGWLKQRGDTQKRTDLQQVNRYLLHHRYLNAKQQPALWAILMANKTEIERRWRELERFYLECGDHYALLLDDYRRPSESRPFLAAVRVAHTLGAGLREADYTKRIKHVWQQLYPNATLNVSAVKQMMTEMALAYVHDGFVRATPLALRYAVQMDEEAQTKW